MGKALILLSAVLLISGCVGPTVYIKDDFSAEKAKRIAVLPFESSEKNLGFLATDIFTSEFVTMGKFEVVERGQLAKIVEEQKLGQQGALDAATIKEIGKMLGVDAVVVGSIYPNYRYKQTEYSTFAAKEIKNINLNVRLIEVETGSILWSGSQNSHKIFGLSRCVDTDEQIRAASRNIIKAFKKILCRKEIIGQ